MSCASITGIRIPREENADKSICRIGVFYDGSFFTCAQYYFHVERKLGWLAFQLFHTLVENLIREKEQGYSNCRAVYAGW